jgi:hypothetical protein
MHDPDRERFQALMAHAHLHKLSADAIELHVSLSREMEMRIRDRANNRVYQPLRRRAAARRASKKR